MFYRKKTPNQSHLVQDLVNKFRFWNNVYEATASST